MFKSIKKVLVGVLAASLMLTSVAFAAESPSKAVEPVKQTATKSTMAANSIKKENVTLSFEKAKTNIKAKALKSTTKTLKLNAKSKNKVVVKKDAFKNANKNLKLTVNKYVKIEKKAFGTKKSVTKKMIIYVDGYSNSKAGKAAFKKYAKSLRDAGFAGDIYRTYKGKTKEKYTK